MQLESTDVNEAQHFFYFLPTEKDNYEPCAGDTMRKCLMNTQTRWEQKGIKNWFIMVKTYVDCFEEEVRTCGAAILRHFVANFEVFLKHLGKMVEEIPPPSLP